MSRSFQITKRLIGRDPDLIELFWVIQNADENPENGIHIEGETNGTASNALMLVPKLLLS